MERGFNSLLVQLKVACDFLYELSKRFQFLISTIKRMNLGVLLEILLSFNSLLVQLKAKTLKKEESSLYSFNSLLVQLKVM